VCRKASGSGDGLLNGEIVDLKVTLKPSALMESQLRGQYPMGLT